jgi:hypothetical protein
MLSATTPSCGEVHFVPAPFTPEAVQVTYSNQEDISIVRWRVAATVPLTDTSFQLLGADGYQPVDFSRSLFPGGVAPCTDGIGSCVQYVLRGRYAPDPLSHPIRAENGAYGELPGAQVQLVTVDQTLSVVGFFSPKNTTVYVNMKDAVAADGPYSFPRPYERAMWPTSGLCVSDSAPDGVGFSPLDASGGFAPETPLSDAGIYCVASRPLPSDGGAATMVQTRIATAPEVVDGQQTFTPKVESAPVIYQIVLDLEIPVPDRCAAAISTIESLVRTYLSMAGTPVHQIPTINLADGGDGSSSCAQVDGRSLQAADMAQAVKQVVTSEPEVFQQFHLLYFNNLDAPLPDSLVQSFNNLFGALGPPPGYALDTIAWLFNPGGGQIPSLPWRKTTTWITADDPSFERELAMYASDALPYMSQEWDSSTAVPILSDSDAAADAGQLIKICASSPTVQPSWSGGPSALIDSANPPSYFVGLPSQIETRHSAFVANSVLVTYQICTRYCSDHPYVSASGTGAVSWSDSPLCASGDY